MAATAEHVPNIVEQFKCALESCDRAHACVSLETPSAPPEPRSRVTFSVPFAPAYPPHLVAEEVCAAAPAPALPAPALPDAKPTRSRWRIFCYVAAGVALILLALYLRKRLVLPLLLRLTRQETLAETRDASDEEEPPARPPRVSRRRPTDAAVAPATRAPEAGSDNALAAMAAYFRGQGDAAGRLPPPEAVAPPEPPEPRARGAAVDLRRVRFSEKSAVDEADPNFLPL